jgi:hypothetical protein
VACSTSSASVSISLTRCRGAPRRLCARVSSMHSVGLSGRNTSATCLCARARHVTGEPSTGRSRAIYVLRVFLKGPPRGATPSCCMRMCTHTRLPMQLQRARPIAAAEVVHCGVAGNVSCQLVGRQDGAPPVSHSRLTASFSQAASSSSLLRGGEPASQPASPPWLVRGAGPPSTHFQGPPSKRLLLRAPWALLSLSRKNPARSGPVQPSRDEPRE